MRYLPTLMAVNAEIVDLPSVVAKSGPPNAVGPKGHDAVPKAACLALHLYQSTFFLIGNVVAALPKNGTSSSLPVSTKAAMTASSARSPIWVGSIDTG